MKNIIIKTIEKLERLWGFLFFKTGPGVLLVSGLTVYISSFFVSEGEPFPEFSQPIILVGVLYLLLLIFLGIVWIVLKFIESKFYD